MTAPLAALLTRWRPNLLPRIPDRLVVPPSARAFFLAGLATHGGRPVLAVVASEREAEELVDDLALFTEAALLLPAWETLPFEHVSPNLATMARRAQARHTLRRPPPQPSPKGGGGAVQPSAEGGGSAVVVASVRAATQRVSISSVEPLTVAVRDERDRDALVTELVEAGYRRTDRVEARGELAVRGGIVDLFPAQAEEPVRLDFLGDTVEELRLFSVSSQRSVEAVRGVAAYPARELRPGELVRERARSLAIGEPWAAAVWERFAEGLLFPGMESWLPWLAPPATVLAEAQGAAVVIFDPVRAGDRSRELVKEESELAAALASTWGHGAPEAGDHPPLYLPLEEALERTPTLDAPPIPSGPEQPSLEVRGLEAIPGDPESVAEELRRLRGRGIDVVVAMDGEAAADRVARVLAESGLVLERRVRLAEPGSAVLAAGIHQGFVMPALRTAVLGEQEIAGRRRAHRRPGPRRAPTEEDTYRDLSPGDYVVHYRHGIGRFEGLVTRAMAGVERDYLLVAYAAGDKLYVPTDQLAAIRRYAGGEQPRISRMGGADWSATRGRVRQAVAAVAEHVVALHRARAQVDGFAFSPDAPWQAELESSFPFEETPDQVRAVGEVKSDMEADRPMDRLVFGDVGFGKTEVAIRAAFKAVQDGKQVAVLVPTTLLAQQHHQTFRERFAPYPVQVEVLSRFLTPRQQREVLEGLRSGGVDVVIGTHRLLSEDVRFRDLGLLVVDEEHRFGVGAKDRIKAFRTSLDVLTLTATPIPRTLEMALTGIREVSHIRTPPEDRHPILTYVGPYDEQAVSAALRRELLREGQVFYVHNRVQSIDHALARLRGLVPDARYALAHGQMSEGQLEQVMLEFWNREHDVLVATTIIEAGLDLPQVNTLLVERADLLGLAQVYQLRGRVGRSSQRAYAYLFHPPHQSLSEDAYRRLEAVGEFTDLGSGFELAMKDLQIRGAGSILGEVQSGHIAAVGFDLYSQLVAEAVGELQGRPADGAAPAEVRIELPVEAHLPETYVPDQAARLEAYRRLAQSESPEQVADVAAEWEDRYGPLPVEATVLLDIARLRVEALRAGLREVLGLRHEVRLAPVSLSDSQEVRLQRLAPGAVLRASEAMLFLPMPAREGLPAWLVEFFRRMWPSADPRSE
ncbi:MAG: transcription-repair coupling factor [Acidimicrobiia bacterium]